MRSRLTICLALALMAGGLWWQLKGRSDALTVEATVSPSTESPQDFFSQETIDTSSDGLEPIGEVDPQSLQSPEEAETCRPDQQGYGIVMKSWGPISLPYADTWPKNEPGQPVDCAPDSDFGAAVVAVHSLYLEEYSPESIPQIASDTPARKLRISQHQGEQKPQDTSICQPLGWNKKQDISIWYIYFECEAGSINFKPIQMERNGDTWLIVYDVAGRISFDVAPPGVEYFPFESGD